MTAEKWTPKVGDVVAIVRGQLAGGDSITKAQVTRALKRYVEVTERGVVRKFDLNWLSEVGQKGWHVARISPWSAEHTHAVARAIAVGRLRQAADAAFATGEGRARIEALPTARLDEAAAFLRALVEEAKAVKA